MDEYFAAFHTWPKPSFLLKIHVLYIFSLLEISASFRQGENGRYLYNDDLGFERYCHYCPPGTMNDSENIMKYQEPRCFDKNFPFQEKCDQEELERKLRPICKSGTLPSCPLLKMPKDGQWNCTLSFFYNVTSDGYFIPVYTICQLTCDPGFQLTEGASTYCSETRFWDRDPNAVTCHRSKPTDEADAKKTSSNEIEGTEHSKIRRVTGRLKYKELTVEFLCYPETKQGGGGLGLDMSCLTKKPLQRLIRNNNKISSDTKGHQKISRRQRKKLSQILRLEEKSVKLKTALLSELGRHNMLNILLR